MKAFGTWTLSITPKELEKSGIFERQRQTSESVPSFIIFQMDYRDLFMLLN
ncbi:MAG: hypothetical protein K0R16_1167 [Nitrososphaeraceae archaeon]|jgi:hypothetical protein|nr:hypothetical protein [Nitrososphaeraceae archaeon]MDF2768950.1 hypothetical protein [Nitrososphaeraceae archaeon]